VKYLLKFYVTLKHPPRK